EAIQLNHNYLGTEHILLGLLAATPGVALSIISSLGIPLEAIRQETLRFIKPGSTPVPHEPLPFTPRAKNVLESAVDEARAMKHDYVGTEHLLLGLLREEEGLAAQILMNQSLRAGRRRPQC